MVENRKRQCLCDLADETSGGSEKERLSHERPGGSRMPDDEDGTVELIRRYIAEKLGFYSEESTDKSEKPKHLKLPRGNTLVHSYAPARARSLLFSRQQMSQEDFLTTKLSEACYAAHGVAYSYQCDVH
ncbi:hypothetical protein J6590_059536 [Homalodisca vitripennis]|nr:hypothetical protein J6590_059536 [Homalodisca vitripennis]